MTPAQAVTYSLHAPPLDPHSEREMLRAMLTDLLAMPGVNRSAKLLLHDYLAQAEAFQRSSAPGHETWYHPHLHRATLLAKLLKPSGTD